jgi:hypothetical protein
MFGVTIIKPGPTGFMQKSSLEFLVKGARLVKMVCQLLVIVAFLFLILVVISYAGPVAWVAVGLTAYGLVMGLFWVQWVRNPGSTDGLLCPENVTTTRCIDLESRKINATSFQVLSLIYACHLRQTFVIGTNLHL